MNKFLIFGLLFGLNLNLLALDLDGVVEMNSLGNGACLWSSNKDLISIVSFNEGWSKKTSHDLIAQEIQTLLQNKNLINKNNMGQMSFGLHCGGYGSSIVGKIETIEGQYCFWIKKSSKDFELRSFGFSSIKESLSETSFCQGNRIGDLIIAIRDLNIVNELKKENAIKNVSNISKNVYKIELSESYLGHEEELKKYLLGKYSNNQVEYIEFNEFQHAVGEFVELK